MLIFFLKKNEWHVIHPFNQKKKTARPGMQILQVKSG
jgi:hypothetical protein